MLSDSVAGNSLVPCQHQFFQLEGGIISTDDRSSDVLAIYGSLDFRTSHQKKMLQRLNADIRQKVYILAEEWTYNLGRTSLPCVIILKNGGVAKFRAGNHRRVKL